VRASSSASCGKNPIDRRLFSPQDLLAHLAEHLPAAVDKMTPNGQIPPAA